ncbi:unnamed protein product [Camellia sinensis]
MHDCAKEFEKTSLFPPLSLSSISLDQTYITRNTMQDFIGSVRQSLVFKPFGGFVEKIGSSIRKSVIGLFLKPSVPELPLIAKSDAIKVKKDDALTIQWRKGVIRCGAFGRVYMGYRFWSSSSHQAGFNRSQQRFKGENARTTIRGSQQCPLIESEFSDCTRLFFFLKRYLGQTREEESLNILLEIVPGGSISSLLGKFGSFPEF